MKIAIHRQLRIPATGILLLLAAFGGGCATTGAGHLAPTEATPVMTEDPKLQDALRQLDVFFDQNPLIEGKLRQNIARASEAAFAQEFPAWQTLTRQNPVVSRALQAESRFLLHRALVRMAGNSRLERRNLQRLDRFLDAHPAIQKELEADPRLLLSADFHLQHPSLAEFLVTHPDLSSAFYENSEKTAVD